MSEKLDTQQLTVWRLFITAHAILIDTIDGELARAGCVPLHWYDVLIELYEAPERRLRMSELARKVVLSKSGLTRLVDKLENAGLLHRAAAESDGRGAFAVITDAGIAALRQAWPVYADGIQSHFAAYMNEDEAAQLTSVFTRVLDGLAE
jgi:DNA-binding MarR family transcriptional regulator